MKIGDIINDKGDKKLKEVFNSRKKSPRSRAPLPHPSNDGITHINIYYTGKSDIGRHIASNNGGFNVNKLGRFQSINGFLLYIAHYQDDKYRYMKESDAGKLVRMLNVGIDHNTRELLKDAYYSILNQNKSILNSFIESTAPFKCYFLRTIDDVVIPTYMKEEEWVPGILSELREELRNGPHVSKADYSKLIEYLKENIEEAVEAPVQAPKAKTKVRKNNDDKNYEHFKHNYVIEEGTEETAEETVESTETTGTDEVVETTPDNE